MTSVATARQTETATLVRDAAREDNTGLIALAAACPMRGAIAIRIDRGPDFFALSRLEGDRSRVGLIERDGFPVGCIGASERNVYLNGVPTVTGYVGDLKVHPAHRDTLAADALCRYATDACRSLPPGVPTMITVLAGNRAMERRLSGPRGLPRFQRLATIRTHSVSVLWKRRVTPTRSFTIRPAEWRDLDAMSALWNVIAPERQFASVLDAESLARLIQSAPGLDISSYLVAHSPTGKLVGFAAMWDQSALKQLYVESYSTRMAVARRCFNALARVTGSEQMPAAGAALNHRTAFHICVPSERPEILRALLLQAHNDLRRTGSSFFNVGLDTRDPLTEALSGLFAQPTDVDVYVTAPAGMLNLAALRSLPVHYEIALV